MFVNITVCSMGVVCKGCQESGNDLPLYKCDGCTSYWCKACGQLSASEIKVLVIKGARTMKFFCTDCSNFNTVRILGNTIQDKNAIILSKDRIIELLEKELEDKRRQLQECQNVAINEPKLGGRTYADAVVSGSDEARENVPCLLIKPKTQQTSSKTKGELQTKINPGKISAGVNMVKELKNGTVILKCNSSGATQRMKSEARAALGDRYTISETRLLAPSIQISNISKGMIEAELVDAVRSQNEFLNGDDELKLKTLKNTRDGKSRYAVLQCNRSCFRKIMAAGKINVGFNKCPVYENFNLIRCYKCCRFNHIARDCVSEEPVCSKCTGPHSSVGCAEPSRKCANCTYFNSKFGCKFDTQHDATDRSCSVYLQKLKVFRQRINYSVDTLSQ